MSDPVDDTRDYTTRAGAAAVGARLRRLSERIDRDAARLYAELGVDFEQRWFGVVNQLRLHDALSVGRLAEELGVSHAAVSQVRAGLEKAGLIAWEADRSNARLRRLRLTAKGLALVETLEPFWRALSDAAVELNEEAGDAVAALERLEAATGRQSLYDRVRARLGG
jgi:DNA-binding MarR family transcriptional regulator